MTVPWLVDAVVAGCVLRRNEAMRER